MPINKSEGVTPTERLLAELCERSFLKLWSYPNPFKEDGNELCDLLAVFENRILIFFDRESRQFDDSSRDHDISWDRWRRKVIDAQVRTAHGAERYIRSGRGIFLDKELSVRFPIGIDLANATIHKIVVAHGAKEACEKFSPDNIYGSLGVSYGASDHGRTLPGPFMVEIDRHNPVHVFDTHNLPIVLGELDTFPDFSTYLDAKLAAIKTFDGLAYCGEEDLLAHYLLNFDSGENRRFIGPKDKSYNFVMIGEGEWKDFIQLEGYKGKKQADEISYLWDKIIQRTCQNALDGTLLGNSNVLKGQSAIHEMAKEPRISRRALAARMVEAIRNFPDNAKGIMRQLTLMSSIDGDKAYVFLQLKMDDQGDYERDYRPKRRALLEIACGIAKNKFPQLKKVIGIAIDAPKYSKGNSEDFILMDCSHWSANDRAAYEEANKEFGFFEAPGSVVRQMRIREFPTS